jgi:hypothetical protein
MNILLENSATIKSDSDYADIIAKPTIRKAMPREVETVQSSEDQEFLSKLMVALNKNAATVKTVNYSEYLKIMSTITFYPILSFSSSFAIINFLVNLQAF